MFVHKGRITRFRRNIEINNERLRISEDVTIKTEGLKGTKGAILSNERVANTSRSDEREKKMANFKATKRN